MSSGYKCHNCGKGIMIGHDVSHAKNRLRRIFKPNLHPAKITVDGTTLRVRLCTKCLRELRGRSARQVKNNKLNLKSSEISTSVPAAVGLV